MPTETTKVTPQQAIAKARQLYGAGDYAPAGRICDAIIKARPKDADALNLAAAVKTALGQMDDAVSYMQKAVALHPNNPTFLANLAEMQRRTGDLDDAVATARRAVEVGPNAAISHANLGIILYEKGELQDAKAAHETALALDPNLPKSVNNLGSIARDEDDRETAIKHYRRALRLAPTDDEIASNLGTVLLEEEQEEDALRLLLPYIRSRPSVSAEIHAVVGRAHLRTDALDDSERAFRCAISIDPKHVNAHVGLSQVLQQKNHADKAAAVAVAAVRIDPESVTAHHQAGLCLSDLSEPDRAETAYEKALEIDPDFHPALISLGYLAMERGDATKARAIFERAITKKPDEFGGHLGLVRLAKVKEGDPAMTALEEAARDKQNLNPKRAIALHYALGKGYEDLKRYDDAWSNYAAGAALKRAEIDYDVRNFEDTVDHIIEIMTQERIAKMRAAAISDDTPIFVLGMPRSGTTLTETILASHPDVFGAGELNDLGRLLPAETGDPAKRYPHIITQVVPAEMKAIAESYIQGLKRRAPQSPHITDKMPANFMYLGLIHALMPNARIIHTVRDPMDTCVSCFTRLFDRAQLQSYEQTEIARYHNAYRRLMAHWRCVLPHDAFLDFEYEGLVADFEPQARRLVDWAGLEWNEACLDFHLTKRSVRTASVTQVRQPVYTSSVKKWENYKDHLAPMMATLGVV